MSITVMALVLFNMFLGLGLVILWIRQTRPAKEDPRLSRGLQLLQSKIAVLEDLSDRTETQVKQLTMLLDERAKILQAKMLAAEETMAKIDHSMRRSLDVADIFQDKIPHEEILERSQQTKYVQAAKLANDGYSVDEILTQVDLPRSEVELIAKVNRDELTFDKNLLPEWAKAKLNVTQALVQGDIATTLAPTSRAQNLEAQMLERVFQTQAPNLSSLQKIENDFKRSVRDAEEIEKQELARARQQAERAQALRDSASQMARNVASQARVMADQARSVVNQAQPFVNAVTEQARQVVEQSKPLVRKVNFPRITVDKSQLPVTIKE